MCLFLNVTRTYMCLFRRLFARRQTLFCFIHHQPHHHSRVIGTCLHEDVLQIISSACTDFTLACQLVELIDAAWHKVEETEKLTLAAISLFFADKHSWLHALQSTQVGRLLGTLPHTLESAADKVYSTCAAVHFSRTLRAGPDISAFESLTRPSTSSQDSHPAGL